MKLYILFQREDRMYIKELDKTKMFNNRELVK